MRKWIPVIASGVIGCALAAVTAWGVISSSTAAPDHNPASAQMVDYGAR